MYKMMQNIYIFQGMKQKSHLLAQQSSLWDPLSFLGQKEIEELQLNTLGWTNHVQLLGQAHLCLCVSCHIRLSSEPEIQCVISLILAIISPSFSPAESLPLTFPRFLALELDMLWFSQIFIFIPKGQMSCVLTLIQGPAKICTLMWLLSRVPGRKGIQL